MNGQWKTQLKLIGALSAGFRKRWPLTLTGTAVVTGSLYLLGYSYAVRNPYGYLLSVTALLLSLVLAIVSRIQGARLNMKEVTWNTAGTVFSSRSLVRHGHAMEIRGFYTFPFFRLHAEITGILSQKNIRLLYIFRDYSSSAHAESTVIPTPLDIPLSGELNVTARLAVRDFFGLTRSQALDVHTRQIPVLPGRLGTGIRYHSATQGAEEQTKMKASDIERYYMRDYVPGDRFRDINWKASSRGDKLFTRISPVAEEKTHVLTVWVRIHDRVDFPRLENVLHADLIKSWVMTFLTAVRAEHPDYRFRIIAGGEEFQLDADDEFTAFAAFLAGLPCRKAAPFPGELAEAGITEGNVYLFAPWFDPGLSSLERTYPGITFHRHLSLPPAAKNSTAAETPLENKRHTSGSIDAVLLPRITGRDIPFPWLCDPRPFMHTPKNTQRGERSFNPQTGFSKGSAQVLHVNTALAGGD
ncbi:MAG: DUF58 domain-containing protein [Spirochaetales bacterium]|nr:DUF58 domain-containing protein [Spirochaetales bacterium]